MHTDEPRDVQGVDLGYDPRDIDAPKIYKIVAGVFAFAVFFFGGGALWYVYIGRVNTDQHFDNRKVQAAGPRIQGNVAAKIDIMQMRQDERRQMEGYGENRDHSQHIPVDAAIAILAERGLPEIKSDKTATSPGNTIPQNAVGPAGSSTTTSPAQTGPVPTPDAGPGATGSTGGSVAP